MSERDQSGIVDGRQQEATGDAHRFVHVVAFAFLSTLQFVGFFENNDEPGGNFQKRLVPISAERCAQPAVSSAPKKTTTALRPVKSS